MNSSYRFKENISAVILCAGEGTRLKKITKSIPKPLIKIENLNNISILHHLINILIELEIYQIGIVIGHLGNSIRQFISTLEFNNPSIKDKIMIIDSEEQYRLGPLYSLLSMTRDKNFFTSRNHYLILPGDTIFEYDLLKEVLAKISDKFHLIQKHPIVFYRKIGFRALKILLGINRAISAVETTKLGSDIILKKINYIKLEEFTSDKDLKQIIPVTALSYDLINDILKLNQKNLCSSVREILNYMVNKGKKIIVCKIDSQYSFYDIDYQKDLKNIKKKRKGQ
ncbi:MAG: sugar phosphate nucleotidyltransferase [Candidatus Hermodarchaeota archaeon]